LEIVALTINMIYPHFR